MVNDLPPILKMILRACHHLEVQAGVEPGTCIICRRPPTLDDDFDTKVFSLTHICKECQEIVLPDEQK